MNNDSLGTSAISEHVAPENNTPTNNYRRWMTDMAADIAHLKLYQLAIPGAHNSGVDEDGNYHIGQNWAVCQYNDFSSQLAAGARYLDLRLVDSSYKKDIGGKKPTYQFKEIFEFKHGIVSVGRRLSGLVSAVYNFSTENPGEIVIIDFHHYDKGRHYSHTSLQRCLPYFNSIKNRLIPPSASDLSIGEIRQTHPGCNIILCLSHGSPDNWPGGVVRKDQIWSPLSHKWTSDATETNVTSLVAESMRSPPSGYWVLSAAAGSPPKDLRADHPIRTEAFAPGRQNVNILMIDFINGSNARTSVVDPCIALNRLRAADKSSPTTPTNFVVTPKNETIVDGRGQNTLVFSWTPSTDNLGVQSYEIRKNGIFFTSTNTPPQEYQNFPLKNYAFAVRGVDTVGNYSAWSNTFDLIQDTTPPTIPDKIFFTNLHPTYAHIQWEPSIDRAGVVGYEVYLDEKYFTFVEHSNIAPSVNIDKLISTEEYTVKIRAKDINDLYSEFATITIPTRPSLINSQITISRYDETSGNYYGNILWETEVPTTALLVCHVDNPGYTGTYEILPRQIISFPFTSRQIGYLEMNIQLKYGGANFESVLTTVTTQFDLARPEPISNLKITSSSLTTASISWTSSPSAEVKSYAISLNENFPISVPSSVNTYTFEKMPPNQTIIVEVWALNDVDIPSALESITIEPTPPEKPGAPEASQLTDTSATLLWPASEGVQVRYGISLNGTLVAQTDQTEFTITHLRDHTDYLAEIRAFNDAGESDPATVAFKTLLSPPANLRFSQVNGRCRLAWNPVFGKLASHEVSINGQVFTAGAGRYGYNFKLSELSPGPAPHRFTFKVRAQLDGNNSEESVLEKTLVDDVPPTQPGAPVASAITDKGVTLSWEPASDNVGVTAYQIVLNGLFAFTTQDTRHTFNDLVSGAYHHVVVRSQDKDGNVSAPSKRTVFKTTGEAPSPPPSAPSVSVTAETATSLTLEWSPLDGAAGVRISLNEEQWRDVLLLQKVSIPNLFPSVEYTISVSTFDIWGQLSEPTILSHELRDVIPPSAPSNLVVSTSTKDSVMLTWEASTDDIGICNYVIYNNHEYFDRTPLTNYSAIGLMPGTHTFEVLALDLSGNLSEPASIIVDIKDGTAAAL
ncbi:hypothetical protein PS914_04749 [Pseudomonas fluorescens]|uniref:fibronectin type III domain-containing protein n=1 Tax=Pseudomonas fluorescens TaxID=294 RepID=UPI001240CD08|nr:hypothetical protein [Pseudomonas fluorescens]VVQ07539.1 hypothetical protein PS914_04749 [Pseudomonas fluorescens]